MDEWVRDQTLEQGTEAWLQARSRRIGGSDIAVILGLSPYKTKRQLFEEKMGRRKAPDLSRMPHVQRGVRAEPVARRMMEMQLGVKYATPVLVHPELSWAVASVDGVTTDHVIEIKCMGRDAHEATSRGEVPRHYKPQVLWNMMIADKAFGYFVSFRPEDGTLHKVRLVRDTDWEQMALAAASVFMSHLEAGELPEEYVYTG